MRVAYVSGGGSGIGSAIARSLALDDHHVLIFGRRAGRLRDSADAIRAAGGRVDPVVVDLVDPVAVRGAVDQAREIAGDGVDVIVNAAGGTSPLPASSLVEVAAEWQDEWQLNVLTAVLLTTAALPQLRRPDGRVINLSSIAALRGGGSYGAAKAALHAWTHSLAGQLGPGGTANVVAPGYIEDTEFFRGGMTDSRREMLIGQTLNGRAGTPDDIAATVHWLAAPAAGHITGQVIQVNGGALLGRG
ncbi:MAG TPA: SDR family oxidoreductase [Mycobacteriales bacterium]|nr:SDR family oxidoreductase [Mycobacteriales bacterium]